MSRMTKSERPIVGPPLYRCQVCGGEFHLQDLDNHEAGPNRNKPAYFHVAMRARKDGTGNTAVKCGPVVHKAKPPRTKRK